MKTLIARLSLLVAATLFSLLIVEQGFRIYVFGLNAFSPAKLDSVRRLGTSGLLQASDVSELIFELRPNLDTIFKLVPFRTNSRGMQDRELDPRELSDAVRVAVVGDSLTMPTGVALSDAYHSKLEQRFSALGDGRRYEFLNLGVGGYSLRQYVAAVEHRALYYSPHLILIGFTASNDYEIPDPDRFDRPYRVRRRSSPFFESFAWKTIEAAWVGSDLHGSSPASASPAERLYMAEQLAKIGELCLRHSTPCVLAYLWHGESDPGPLPELARNNGLEFVDVSAAFSGRRAEDFAILPIDAHPNPEAHAIFADVLFLALKPRL